MPKVFWFRPFERSKPLGVFALIVRFCRRFFGSDLLKGRSPLSFLHLLCVFAVGFLVRTTCKVLAPAFLDLLSVCFFAEGFLVRTICKVETPWRFSTYCALVPKVFGCGPFERSKPLGVFALILRFCRRFFGSDLLKGRSPLAFFHLLCVFAEGILVRTF